MRTAAVLGLVAAVLLGASITGIFVADSDGGARHADAAGQLVGDHAFAFESGLQAQFQDDDDDGDDDSDDEDGDGDEDDDGDDDDGDDDDEDDDGDDGDDSDETNGDEEDGDDGNETEDDGEGDSDEDDDSGLGPPFLSTPTSTPERTPTATPDPTSTPEGSPTFEVVAANLEASEATVGEYVAVTATVENRGEEDGTHEVELRVDDEAVATETVSVPAGETATVEFQVQFGDPGAYDVAVDGASAGTLSVTPREAPGDGVEVIDAVLPADRVQPGVEVTVRATVENPNDRPANTTLNVTVDGEPVARRDVSLGPRERTEVTIPFEATGGAVAVDGVDAGHLNVSDSLGRPADADAEPSERSGMAFGVLAAMGLVLCAILVAASVRWRRHDATDGPQGPE